MVLLRLALWISAGVACQRTVAVPAFEVPVGTQAVTIARQTADGAEIWAATWPASSFGFDGDGDGELELMAWRCSVEHLGLIEGRQSLREEPAGPDLLPDPAGRWRSRFSGSEAAPWAAADDEARLEVWQRLLVSNDNRCLAGQGRFVPRPVVIQEPRGRPTFSVRLDDRRIMIGARSRDGEDRSVGIIVERSGAYEIIDLGAPLKVAAFYSDEGDLWLFDRQSTLSRGPLEGPYTPVATAKDLFGEPDYASMDGARGGAPFELFVNTSSAGRASRRFGRFDGERWEVLAGLYFDQLFIPSVAWIGPGQAIGLGAGDVNNQTVRYDRGTVRRDRLPGSNAGAASIRYLPRLGPVVGRDDGELNLFEDGEWVPLGGVRDTVYTRSLAPVGDGLIFSTGTEINFLEYRYGQYYPALGTCPLQELTDYAAGIMTAFGDGSVLAVTLADFEAPVEPVILELQVPPHACSAVEP
jgi:hypothetical protein